MPGIRKLPTFTKIGKITCQCHKKKWKMNLKNQLKGKEKDI